MASERLVIPLQFNQGIQREFDTQEHPQSGSRIINWQPTPTGGLRVKRRWNRGQTTGIPATRKVRGLGHVPTFSGYLTPYRRQMKRVMAKDNTRVTSIRAPWWRRTVEGNFLLAFLVYADKPADSGINGVTVTAPSGWTQLNDAAFPVTHSGNHIKMRVYRINDAAERNGYETFSFGAGPEQPVKRAQLYIMEWANIDRVSAFDITKSDSGTSAVPSSGLAAVTTQPQELVVGMLAGLTVDRDLELEDWDDEWYDFRLPKDVYAIGHEDKWLAARVFRQVLTNEDQVTLTARFLEERGDDTGSSPWVAGLVTIKARNRAYPSDGQYVVAHRASDTSLSLYSIDEDTPTTSAWSNIWTSPATVDADIIGIEVDKVPIRIVGGMGGGILCHPDLPSLYHYDGDRVTRIRRAPSGRACALHKNRYFVGGSRGQPNRLYWSNLGDFTTWGEDSWLDVGFDGSYITDILPALDGLLIAKDEGVYFLSGSGPSSFGLSKLAGGKGQRGNCMVEVPGGALLAAKHQIYLWQGGGAGLISKPLSDWWTYPANNADRLFVSTAHANGLVFVSHGKENTICVYDSELGIWWADGIGKGLVGCWDDHRLIWGPWESTEWSLLNWQRQPEGERTKNEVGSMTFVAETQELLLGSPSSPITPRHLWVAWQQREYQVGDPGITVTPIYDGYSQNTRSVLLDTDGNGDYRTRLDVWVHARTPVHKVKFKFERTITASQPTVMDIEALEFVYDKEDHR